MKTGRKGIRVSYTVPAVFIMAALLTVSIHSAHQEERIIEQKNMTMITEAEAKAIAAAYAEAENNFYITECRRTGTGEQQQYHISIICDSSKRTFTIDAYSARLINIR